MAAYEDVNAGLAKAMAAGAQAQVPVTEIPELAKFFKGAVVGAAGDKGAQAYATSISDQANYQASVDKANQEKAMREAAEQVKRAEAALDPANAYAKRNEAGGIDFYNGADEKMSVQQYSLLTGKKPEELLADSEDPNDRQFVEDYGFMRKVTEAIINKDYDFLDQVKEADPVRFQTIQQLAGGGRPLNEGVKNITNAFRQYYPQYYSVQPTVSKEFRATHFSDRLSPFPNPEATAAPVYDAKGNEVKGKARKIDYSSLFDDKNTNKSITLPTTQSLIDRVTKRGY